MNIDLNALLETYRNNPFEDYVLQSVHTGIINFKVQEDQEVHGPEGKWHQKPGTLLYTLERENNIKKIYSPCSGTIIDLRRDLNGSFTEAGVDLMSIRHRLDKDEVIDRILKDVLILFTAPQRARYLLSPEFAVKIEKQSQPFIHAGDEPIIMSLMKRDTNLVYSNTPGVIYKVYFQQGALVEEGAPLLGVCQEENLSYIQQVVNKIKTEWE
ncbi:MAG: hypothetical protein ABWK15_06230 [Dissulfuribacterales bacterium]